MGPLFQTCHFGFAVVVAISFSFLGKNFKTLANNGRNLNAHLGKDEVQGNNCLHAIKIMHAIIENSIDLEEFDYGI